LGCFLLEKPLSEIEHRFGGSLRLRWFSRNQRSRKL